MDEEGDDAHAETEEFDESHLTRLHSKFVAMVKAMRLPQVNAACASISRLVAEHTKTRHAGDITAVCGALLIATYPILERYSAILGVTDNWGSKALTHDAISNMGEGGGNLCRLMDNRTSEACSRGPARLKLIRKRCIDARHGSFVGYLTSTGRKGVWLCCKISLETQPTDPCNVAQSTRWPCLRTSTRRCARSSTSSSTRSRSCLPKASACPRMWYASPWHRGLGNGSARNAFFFFTRHG